jgi:hypothetical protein
MNSTPNKIPNKLGDDLLDKVTNLAKRRGFIFPVGRDLRRIPLHLRLRPPGRQHAAQRQAGLVARDGPDALGHRGLGRRDPGPPAIWAASGHLETFTDPLVDCKKCKERWREDKIDGVCPELRLDRVHRGPGLQPDVQDPGRSGRGRGRHGLPAPRDGPGHLHNFANVLSTVRKKPPFGIAQIGKSFRNEITPQNFVFRTREFEQMEMEYFVPPADAEHWYRYWIDDTPRLVPRPGYPRRATPPARARQRGPLALLARHDRRGVPLPVGLGRTRGRRQPRRLRPDPARQRVGRRARVLRSGRRTSATRPTSSSRPPAPRAR